MHRLSSDAGKHIIIFMRTTFDLPDGRVFLGGPAARAWKARVARLTGLEPATPGVTGRYSNQLSYNRSPSARIAPSVWRCLRSPTPPVKPRRAKTWDFPRFFSRPPRFRI